MNTYVDFLEFTKGIGYVLAAVFLVGFIPFWLFLTEREKKD